MAKQMTDPKSKARVNAGCRCLEIGVDRFAECQKQGPATCSYALPFGYCFLCTHPNLDQILENTKKAQAAAKIIA
jgi:hypothetical protein